MVSVLDQSNELSGLDSDDESVSPDYPGVDYTIRVFHLLNRSDPGVIWITIQVSESSLSVMLTQFQPFMVHKVSSKLLNDNRPVYHTAPNFC